MRVLDDSLKERNDQIFDSITNLTDNFSAGPRMLFILILDDLHTYSWDKLSKHVQMMLTIDGYIDEWNRILPNLPIDEMLDELKY